MRVKRRLIASLAGCTLARSRNRPESPPRDFIRLLRLDPMSSSKGLLPGGPDHPMAWPMKVRSGSNGPVPRREREGLQSLRVIRRLPPSAPHCQVTGRRLITLNDCGLFHR